VSQRIKALEQQVSQVPVVREKPCTATTAGVPLLRLLEVQALAQVVQSGAANLHRHRSATDGSAASTS
jgi:LysR family transcriptional regulator, chromosome initiation inhibitor